MRLKVLASLGGTLVIMLEEKSHLVSLVSLSRWKIASGTWTSWHEERSAKRSGEKDFQQRRQWERTKFASAGAIGSSELSATLARVPVRDRGKLTESTLMLSTWAEWEQLGWLTGIIHHLNSLIYAATFTAGKKNTGGKGGQFLEKVNIISVQEKNNAEKNYDDKICKIDDQQVFFLNTLACTMCQLGDCMWWKLPKCNSQGWWQGWRKHMIDNAPKWQTNWQLQSRCQAWTKWVGWWAVERALVEKNNTTNFYSFRGSVNSDIR